MQNPHEGISTESLLPSASNLPPLPLPPSFTSNNPTAVASATPLPPTPVAKDGTSGVTIPAGNQSKDNRPATPDYYFSPGNRSMPGAYSPVADPRTQTPSTTVPYTTTTATTASTPPQRRISGNSLRSFLSGFRRSSGKENSKPRNSTDTTLSGPGGYISAVATPNNGNSTPSQRPSTPGGSSLADSTSRPSLRSKMSGAFGRRRKSSLSNMLGHDETAGESLYSNSPRSVGNNSFTNQNASQETGFTPPSPQLTRLYSDEATPQDSSSETSSLRRARRKISSTLFSSRRQSSLRTEFEPSLFSPTSSNGGAPSSSAAILSPTSPQSANSFKRARSPTHDDINIDDASMSPPPSSLRKRKSGMSGFWRSKSTLNAALNGQIAGDNGGQSAQKQQQQAAVASPRRMDLDEEGHFPEDRFPEEEEEGEQSRGQPHQQQQEMMISRTPSPPPVLPELKLGGDLGLGKGDSGVFMDEGLFERIG